MYRPELRRAYKDSRSKLPIDVWVEVAAKHLPEFQTPDDIYAPVELAVKVAGGLNDPTGTVNLSVSCVDENWYPKLLKSVGEMMKQPVKDIVDMTGKSIRSCTPAELARVGECDVVASPGGVLRLASPVQPPKHMVPNKMEELKSWWEGSRDRLADAVAKQLQDKNKHEIALMVAPDGPVHKTIQAHLEGNTPYGLKWNEFSATFGNGRASSEDLSLKLLDEVHKCLGANEEQIDSFRAHATVGASIWKKSAATKYGNEMAMYRDILQDVVHHPLVSQAVVHAVAYGTRSKKTGPMSSVPQIAQAAYHPLHAYYHLHHMHVHNKLPGHVLVSGSIAANADKPYRGSTKSAFDMFNLFIGNTIDCGVCGKKKPKAKKIDAKIPPLVHVSTRYRSIEGHHAHKHSKDEHHHKHKHHDDIDSKLPPLIPIEGSLPPLIPIEAKLPPLIPIGHEMDDDDDEEDLPHLEPGGHHYNAVEVPTRAQLANNRIWVDNSPNAMDFL